MGPGGEGERRLVRVAVDEEQRKEQHDQDLRSPGLPQDAAAPCAPRPVRFRTVYVVRTPWRSKDSCEPSGCVNSRLHSMSMGCSQLMAATYHVCGRMMRRRDAAQRPRPRVGALGRLAGRAPAGAREAGAGEWEAHVA